MTEEAMQMALEALEKNRRTHHYCEDTWYSCPKHEDGCANDSEGDACNCGADETNAQIDKAITALRQALKQPTDERSLFDCGTYVGSHIGREIKHNIDGPQPKTERYFCERCGKRSFDGIHTCTPPADTMGDGITLTSVAHPLPYDLNPDALEETEIDLPKPKREWVGLTDEEIAAFDWNHAVVDAECVRAIEAKLKEKNNG